MSPWNSSQPSAKELEQQAESKNKYQRRHAERLLAEQKENGRIQTEYGFPVQAVQFGDDLTLIALPGEAVVDYSLRLKKDFAGNSRVWVAGYSNHVFGYLPSRRVLQEGGYEGGGAMMYSAYPGPFTESVEDRILEQAKKLVGQLRKAP